MPSWPFKRPSKHTWCLPSPARCLEYSCAIRAVWCPSDVQVHAGLQSCLTPVMQLTAMVAHHNL